jgi:hypothetical protein
MALRTSAQQRGGGVAESTPEKGGGARSQTHKTVSKQRQEG